MRKARRYKVDGLFFLTLPKRKFKTGSSQINRVTDKCGDFLPIGKTASLKLYAGLNVVTLYRCF